MLSCTSNYNTASVIPHAIAAELINKLAALYSPLALAPSVILDLGARDAFCSQQLQALYPGAQILAQDKSDILLPVNNFNKICSSLENLPFQNQSVDLVISNLALHWVHDLPQVLCEVKRILKSNNDNKAAVFIFSLFGPYSFRRQYIYPKVSLLDLEILGNLLLCAGFVPIIEVAELTFEYATEAALEFDLEHTGLSLLFNKADKFAGIYEAEVFYVIARC